MKITRSMSTSVALCTSIILSVPCLADERALAKSVDWLKGSLPTNTRIDFNKSKIKFSGCKHRDYDLQVIQPITADFRFEATLGYSKGSMQWGVYGQKISTMTMAFIPRFQLSQHVSLGTGFEYQSAPEFKTQNGIELDLSDSRSLVFNARIEGITPSHYMEVSFASRKWSRSSSILDTYKGDDRDASVSLSYQGSF